MFPAQPIGGEGVGSSLHSTRETPNEQPEPWPAESEPGPETGSAATGRRPAEAWPAAAESRSAGTLVQARNKQERAIRRKAPPKGGAFPCVRGGAAAN